MIRVLEEISKEVQTIFASAKGSHDYDHTLRVVKLSKHIAQIEHANLELVELAAILHDIGRSHQDETKNKVCHAEIGAKMAKEILERYSLDQEAITQICHCIECHRFRNNHIPQTLEAKILYDADKLDSIGAVGIGRTFLFAGEVHAKLHDPNPNLSPNAEYTIDDTAYREFVVKLSKIKGSLFTNEAKRIAASRHAFMEEFFIRLNKEVDGIL